MRITWASRSTLRRRSGTSASPAGAPVLHGAASRASDIAYGSGSGSIRPG
jgi:hypothetical protein